MTTRPGAPKPRGGESSSGAWASASAEPEGAAIEDVTVALEDASVGELDDVAVEGVMVDEAAKSTTSAGNGILDDYVGATAPAIPRPGWSEPTSAFSGARAAPRSTAEPDHTI